MKEYSRTERVADQVQRELAQLLQFEVKDPRIGMLTITGVQINRELDVAKVFYTVLGDEQQREKTAVGLEKASGYLRSELGKRLKIRVTPQLRFVYDSSIDEGARLSHLIDQARSKDQEQSSEPDQDCHQQTDH